MNKILDWSIRISNVNNRDIESFGKTFIKLSEDFAYCGENIINGFTEKITSAYTTSKSSIISWGKNVKNWFILNSYGAVNKETFGTYANDIINAFKDKISSFSSNSKNSITSWASNIKVWFSEIVSYSAFYNISKDVVNGFNDGINDFYLTTTVYMRKWADVIKNTFKTALDSHSPSKVFMRIAKDTILGYNLEIINFGNTTKDVVNKWANTFTNINPVIRFAVDTSALKYYTSDSFSKSVSVGVTNSRNVAVTGFKGDMAEFYREYIEPILSQIAADMRRQADKNEQTVIQIGNRTVNDAVTTQRKANGYVFVK